MTNKNSEMISFLISLISASECNQSITNEF